MDGAIEQLREAVRLSPDSAEYRNNLAWYLVRAERFEEALPEARRAVELEPTSPGIRDTLAHAAFGTSSWREAAEAWEKILEIEPTYYEKNEDPLCGEDGERLKEARTKASLEGGEP